MAKLTVLVADATGLQGGAVVQELLERGHRVRGLVRDPAAPAALLLADRGVVLVADAFHDAEAMRAAATGVDGVFVVGSVEDEADDEVRRAAALLTAARAAGVGHVVYGSIAGASRAPDIRMFANKRAVEELLGAADVPYTIVARAFLAENLASPLLGGGLRLGTLAMPLPAERKLQYVAVEELGSFVTLCLERPDAFRGRRVELAFDEVSGIDAAATLTRAWGRPVQYTPLALDAVRAESEDTARLFEWLDRDGFGIDVHGVRVAYPEIGWRTFAEWAADQDWPKLLG
jgi:uncharacterized protein YbjT (DUF2867 family)